MPNLISVETAVSDRTALSSPVSVPRVGDLSQYLDLFSGETSNTGSPTPSKRGRFGSIVDHFLHRLRASRDALCFLRQRHLIDSDWRRRHRAVFKLNPAYSNTCGKLLEGEHRRIWEPLRRRVCLDTIRVCANISGTADPRIIPEEVFAATIERCLNPFEFAPLFSHKSFYSMLFPEKLFPEILMNRIDGVFLDFRLCPMAHDDVADLCNGLEYPVVIKPNINSSGGAGVSFPACAGDLRREMGRLRDFVVQPILKQNAFFAMFNSCGLNTLRVYTYRSVASDKTHVLGVTLRMGQGGSLDNETAGGIVCHVKDGGRLNQYAVDKYGKKFDRHPDTGIVFKNSPSIPDFAGLQETARLLAARLPFMRLAGWDFYMDQLGEWKVLEVNLRGHTIRFAQYAGEPFFGNFTEEVISYCKAHQRAFRTAFRAY